MNGKEPSWIADETAVLIAGSPRYGKTSAARQVLAHLLAKGDSYGMADPVKSQAPDQIPHTLAQFARARWAIESGQCAYGFPLEHGRGDE